MFVIGFVVGCCVGASDGLHGVIRQFKQILGVFECAMYICLSINIDLCIHKWDRTLSKQLIDFDVRIHYARGESSIPVVQSTETPLEANPPVQSYSSAEALTSMTGNYIEHT